MTKPITNELIFNSMSCGIITTDTTGHVVLINEQAENILGLAKNKIIGLLIEETFPMAGSHVNKCLQTRESQIGKHILGKNLRLVVNITPILDDGILLGTVINFQNMQQLERSAEQLKSYKQLNKQLEAIFSFSSDGIWVTDSEGLVALAQEKTDKKRH